MKKRKCWSHPAKLWTSERNLRIAWTVKELSTIESWCRCNWAMLSCSSPRKLWPHSSDFWVKDSRKRFMEFPSLAKEIIWGQVCVSKIPAFRSMQNNFCVKPGLWGQNPGTPAIQGCSHGEERDEEGEVRFSQPNSKELESWRSFDMEMQSS